MCMAAEQHLVSSFAVLFLSEMHVWQGRPVTDHQVQCMCYKQDAKL